MRILYLFDRLAIGGSELSMLQILQRLPTSTSMVCTLYVDNPLQAAYERAGIPVIALNLPGRYQFFRAVRRVSAVVRSQQPNLMHTTLFRADVVGRLASARSRVPVVSSLVNDAYSPMRQQTLSPVGRIKLRVVQEIDRWTAQRASHFVAVSQATKAANCRALGIPEAKVSVIYRGRDPAPFLSVDRDVVHKLRTQLGLREGTPVLLNVARLLQRKGQFDLVTAMPHVLRRFPDATLLIAGQGHDEARLQATIAACGLESRVRLLGQRADVPVLLHLADLFVFPSHFEGHPGALVEAMLAARPIVASDIPVHRECITTENTGLLAATAEPHLLASAIIDLLENPIRAQAMGRRAREVALQRFDIDQVAQQHEALYRSLIQNTP